VRVLSLARVLFVLLAFQLAVGLQIGVAHATMPAVTTASATTDDACPLHGSSSHTSSDDHAPLTAGSHSTPHAKIPHGTSAGKHDCCKSSGCQGQCGSVPLAFNISLSRNSPASTRVQPAGAERESVAPPDTHFRPPIVS
jgi:hypothetical protein